MSNYRFFTLSLTALSLCTQANLQGQTILNVTTNTDTNVSTGGQLGELRYALNTILDQQAQGLSSGDWQINFSSGLGTITLNATLPMINLISADTIWFASSTPVTIDGNSLYRGFFVRQGNVTFQNMIIQNCLAKGGNGGIGTGGGGGGLGGGGALFIDQATVNLENVQFLNNSCRGGDGGTAQPGSRSSGGGGGGMGGSGGNSFLILGPQTYSAGGGGGFVGNGGDGAEGEQGFTPTYGGGGGGGGAGGNGARGGDHPGVGNVVAPGGGGGGAIIGADGGTIGAGGTSVSGFVFGGGGGGGYESSISGGSGGGVNPGSGGGPGGGGGGGGFNGFSAAGFSGGNGGQGGGGGASSDGSLTTGAGGPGGGGGGSAGGSHSLSGSGGYGGGGGGQGSGQSANSSPGGFAGGGGGAAWDLNFSQPTGGQGGFGGGGGGGVFGAVGGLGGGAGGGTASTASGGYGGGNSAIDQPGVGAGAGGGGAGLGAVLFVNNGGTLNFGAENSISGTNTAIGGNGGSNVSGSGVGVGGLFIVSGANLYFSPGLNNTLTINDLIADDSSNSLTGAGNSKQGNGIGGVVTMQSQGTLVLTANNLYAGGTVINDGVVSFSQDSNLGKSGTRVTLNGGTLRFGSSFASSRPITLNLSTSFIDDGGNHGTLSGQISGSGGVTKIGEQTITLSNANNNYSGTTTISSGTLQAGTAYAFSNSSTFTIASGATLDLNNFSQMISNLQGSGNVTLGSLNSVELKINNTVSDTFPGLISGSGQITKTASGTLSLSNPSNLYSGGTRIEAGILSVAVDGNLGNPSGGITLAGGTLEFTNSISSARSVTLIGTSSIGLQGNNISLSGPIAGSGGFILLNTGTLTLSGPLSYSGTTTVPLGVGLQFDTQTQNIVMGSKITGAGGITKLSTGTLTLMNTSSDYTGATTVAEGILQAGASAVFPTSSTHTINAGATLDINGTSQTLTQLLGTGNVTLNSGTLTFNVLSPNTTFNGVISGAGNIIKTANGTLTLTNANTYTATMTISSGVLSVSSNSNLGSGAPLSIGAATLQSTAEFNLTSPITTTHPNATINIGANNLTLSGSITGSGGINVIGSGNTLNYSGSGITYSGNTLITANTLNLSSSSNNTLATSILGTGNVTHTGSGTTTLASTSSYSGSTTISAGVLKASVSGAFSSSSQFTLAPQGTLDVNGTSQTIAGLLGSGNVTLGSSSGTLTIASNAVSDTFSGLISGNGKLIKSGSGTLTLTNSNNSYSGGTQLNSGTLIIPDPAVLGLAGSNFIFAGQATLQFISNTTFANPVIINSAGIIDVGSNAVTFSNSITGGQGFTLAGSGSLTLSSTNNTYGQVTNIPTGTSLLVGGPNVLSPNSALNLGSGVFLNLNNKSQSIGGLAGSGNISVDSATLTIAHNSIYPQYSGVISGTGGLALSSNLVLSSVQAYTGSTFVANSSALILETDAIGSSSSVTTNGGIIVNQTMATLQNLKGNGRVTLVCDSFDPLSPALTLTGTESTTYDGRILSSIAGSKIDAGVIKQGTGSITLTSNLSDYRGGTQFNGGTILITAIDNGLTSGPLGIPTSGILSFDGGALRTAANYTTSKSVVLAGPGTIQVDSSFTSTFNADFSGPGSFTKSGGGILTLSSQNFYTGNTFITEGTLQSSANHAFIFSPLFVLSSAGRFDMDGTLQLINGISGEGTLALGSGELTLVDAGNNTFSGTVTGTGAFIKEGSASLTTSGAFDLTGPSSLLAIQGGVFSINGTARANTVSVTGGTLKGTGTITCPTAVQINAGGVIAPGNSPGPMHIIGDVIFSQNSFLNIEVNPTTASELFATGTVDVTQGTLVIQAETGTYTAGKIYDIVSAPTILTPFEGVQISSQSATRNFSVIYSPTLIQIEVFTLPFTTILGNPCSSNAAATANAYETVNPNNPDSEFITEFLNEANATQLFCDFDQMHLALFNAIAITQESMTTGVRSIFTNRLQEIYGPYCAYTPRETNFENENSEQETADILPVNENSIQLTAPFEQKARKKRGVWVAPFGNFERQDNRLQQGQCDQTRIGFHSSNYGLVVAVDGQTSNKAFDNIILGSSFCYTHTDLSWNYAQARSTANTYLATFYGAVFSQYFYANALLMGGMAYFDAKRHIFLQNSMSELTRTAHHENSAGECDGHLELGALWSPHCVQLRPYISFDYIYLREGSYREKGAHSLDLAVEARTSKLLREEIGLSFSARQSRQSSALSGEIRLAYVREERFRGKETKLRFVDSTSDFQVVGFLPDRNLFAPTASMSFHLSGFSLSATYSGELGKKWLNQSVNLKFLWEF